MKKILFLLVIFNFQLSIINSASACTNILVGKAASADGSVMISYSADSYGMFGNIYRHVGSTHQAGEMRQIYDWDSNRYCGQIPQAQRTYNVVGQMNENQVSITETTFGGREDLWETEGIIDYGSLIYIALERSTSARNAIDIMTSLVDLYGYCSEGESFSIADKNEAWILEMIGKGKGEKGAVWAAVRIPDDCISAHANQSRITRLSQYDKKQVLCSKDVVKFARQKGYFKGKDSEFSFRDAYSPNEFGAVRYCDARVWSILNRFCDGMDQYLEYAKGNDMAGEMPLYRKPSKKLSVQDVMNAMRDHYEGTALDIQNEVGAGPYNMPYRPTPLSFKVGEETLFNERPVSTQQTSFCFVGQMRSTMPDYMGGITWITNDDPNMAPFVPLYCSITDMPRCFQRVMGEQDDVTFSWQSAFWLQNTVSNMVYPYYSKMFPDLKQKRDELEGGFMRQIVLQESNLANNSDLEAVKRQLNTTSNTMAETMMVEWEKLFRYLVVRHNDMAVKKVDANGQFSKTKHGYAESPERPGYPDAYRQLIKEKEGDRYTMPKK